MTVDEFSDRVRSQAPPDVPSDILERALTRHVERSGGRLYAKEVQDVIADARVFSDLGAIDRSGGALALDAPGLAEVSEQLADDIEPWATAWRERLSAHFDATLPFARLDAAIDWVTSAAELGKDVPEDDRTRMREAMTDPHVLEFLGIRDPRTRLSLAFEQPMLALPDFKAGVVSHVAPHPGGPLFKLAREIARVAHHTGFAPWRILLLVLTGHRPHLPAAKISTRALRAGEIPDGTWVRGPNEVTVTFYTPELTLGGLEAVYRQLRAGIWNVEDEAPLTDGQRLVLGGVRELGRRGPTESWEDYWLRIGDWMASRSDGRFSYKTPQGPWKLWEAARKKVSAITTPEDTDV